MSVPNNAAGHCRLIKTLAAKNARARVVLESTGTYGLGIAVALARAPGAEVQVLNPRIASDFRKALGARSKTDLIDADVLRQFAQRMPFVPWQPPRQVVLDLRVVMRRVAALKASLISEKNRRHAIGQMEAGTAAVVDDIDDNIAGLQRRIERLTDAAQQLIAEDHELTVKLALIETIKGFGRTSAVQVLAEISVLPADMTVKQWVAQAGLDPRHRSSGTSIAHKPRISKAGNSRLRHALYMPAMAAATHAPEVQVFYETLQSRGLCKRQALAAIMRKLLHAVYGMLRTQTPYNPALFYTPRP